MGKEVREDMQGEEMVWLGSVGRKKEGVQNS